ncbi:MAG: hypothetical protein M3139_05630 [Bacteroidota bacterium]|nr:hypothetical protein [Bacteroidota bacterium]
MNTRNIRTVIFSLIFMAITLTSCQAIAGIFKAGIWVGIVIVVVIVAIIFWLISKAGKK